MDTIERRFRIQVANPAVLFGAHDAHVRLIEQRLDVTIGARGDQFVVRGEEGAVALAERILRELAFVVDKTDELTDRDVATVIDLVTSGSAADAGGEDADSVILYGRQDTIRAKTPGQAAYMRAVRASDIVFAIGPAGTGKTYLAVAAAVAALRRHDVLKIVLARPAVEAGESLGYLPGDLREKVDPYLRPLYDALDDMLPAEKLKAHLERRVVEIVPLAYMRGRTLNNAFIILDEAQNATSMQMKMFLTRMGPNSRAIITGDITQIDLPSRAASGLVEIQDVLRGVEGVEFVYLEKSDVVRHRLVKDIIAAYERHQNGDAARES
jgi:phosphate starvation-inducible PhoH-like protein